MHSWLPPAWVRTDQAVFSWCHSKWSEASDSRQTLPNAVRGASQRVCWNAAGRWRLHLRSKSQANNAFTSKSQEYIQNNDLEKNLLFELCYESNFHDLLVALVPKTTDDYLLLCKPVIWLEERGNSVYKYCLSSQWLIIPHSSEATHTVKALHIKKRAS